MKSADEKFMRHALALAEYAAEKEEVPVGAVVVLDGEIVGEGYNQPISGGDPTAHAEIIALRNAAEKTGNYRLPNASLYVTIEPCTMCAGAMVHARIQRLIYGAPEPKAGVVHSNSCVFDLPYLNHQVDYTGGVLTEDCREVISEFFKRRR